MTYNLCLQIYSHIKTKHFVDQRNEPLFVHIIKILNQTDIDDEKLSSLSEIRSMYIGELNNIIRNQNTHDMFDKKYWKYNRKSN